MDPFLQPNADNENTSSSVRPDANNSDNVGQSSANISNNIINEEEPPSLPSRDFTVEGQRKDINTIFLKLRIADSTDNASQIRNIHFPFDIEADTSISVATEMVAELDLTDQDVTDLAAMIDAEIRAHVPEWDHANSTVGTEIHGSEAGDELHALPGKLVLERLPSGRKYWSDSPKASSGGSPATLSDEFPREVDEKLEDSNHNKAEYIESLVHKLEKLIVEQQNEITELKRKHGIAIAQLLQRVPPELRIRIFNMCRVEFPDCSI